jgi:ABC-type transporter Mla subunit MlaD
MGNGGYLDNLIDQLESDYQAADQALNTSIQGIQSTIAALQTADVNLQGLIDSLDNRVDQLENDLQTVNTDIDNAEDSINSLTGKVSDVENELDTLGNLLGGTNIGDLANDISNIKSVIDPVLNGDKYLVPKPPNNSTGMLIFWDEENNQPEWRLPDGISGGRLIDPPGELRLTLNTQP